MNFGGLLTGAFQSLQVVGVLFCYLCALLVTYMVKNSYQRICHSIPETQVQSLGLEDPLGKGMATHSSILFWEIPGTEESGRLQYMVLQGVRHDFAKEFFIVILLGR